MLAEVVEPPPVRKPRIWPTLVVGIFAVPTVFVVMVITLVIAAVVDVGRTLQQ